MGVNSLPKTVTRQRRRCDLYPGPSAPESSTLTTRLPSHPAAVMIVMCLLSASVAGAGEQDPDNVQSRHGQLAADSRHAELGGPGVPRALSPVQPRPPVDRVAAQGAPVRFSK